MVHLLLATAPNTYPMRFDEQILYGDSQYILQALLIRCMPVANFPQATGELGTEKPSSLDTDGFYNRLFLVQWPNLCKQYYYVASTSFSIGVN